MSNDQFLKVANSLSPATEISKPKEVWNIDERSFRGYSDLIGDYKEFSQMKTENMPEKAKWEIAEAFEIFLEFQKDMNEKIVKHNKQNTRKALACIVGMFVGICGFVRFINETAIGVRLLFMFASILCLFFSFLFYYIFVSRKKDIRFAERFFEDTKKQEKEFYAGKKSFSLHENIKNYTRCGLFIPYRQQPGVFDYGKFDDEHLVEHQLIYRLRQNHDKIFYNKLRVEDYPLEDFFRFVENPETDIEELDKYAAKKKEA